MLLHLEIITPVHIGAGKEKDYIKDIDYVEDNDRKRLSFIKHEYIQDEFHSMNEAEKSRWISIVTSNSGLSIQNLKEIENSFKKRQLPSIYRQYNAPNFAIPDTIKRNIYGALDNKPYIPGSSIKGAIRSVLLKVLIQELNISKSKVTTKDTFGTIENDILQYLQVSDAIFSKIAYYNSKIFNIATHKNGGEGGWKNTRSTDEKRQDNQFNTVYECIRKDELNTTTFQLKIDLDRIQLLLKQSKEPGIPDKIKKLNAAFGRLSTEPGNHSAEELSKKLTNRLLKIINEHSKQHLVKELGFYKQYDDAQDTDLIIDKYNEIKQLVDTAPEGTAYIKLGQGTGFHLITGDYQHTINYIQVVETGEHKQKRKSRKIGIARDAAGNLDLFPFGWVKISV